MDNNSGAPQIVLVMNEIDAINFQKQGLEIPGCRVIAFDNEFNNEDGFVLSLGKSGLLVDSNVLIKDPYSSTLTYHPLDSASVEIHAEYFKRYATILSFLGATRVQVTEAKAIGEENSIGGSAGVEVNAQGGNASGKWTKSSREENLMSLDLSFEHRVNLPEARKMIERFSLQNDKELCRIMNAVEAGAVHKFFDFTISLSQNLKKIFDFAAGIKPYGAIDIKADMKKNKEITKTYKLHVRVEFNNSQTKKESKS